MGHILTVDRFYPYSLDTNPTLLKGFHLFCCFYISYLRCVCVYRYYLWPFIWALWKISKCYKNWRWKYIFQYYNIVAINPLNSYIFFCYQTLLISTNRWNDNVLLWFLIGSQWISERNKQAQVNFRSHE